MVEHLQSMHKVKNCLQSLQYLHRPRTENIEHYSQGKMDTRGQPPPAKYSLHSLHDHFGRKMYMVGHDTHTFIKLPTRTRS